MIEVEVKKEPNDESTSKETNESSIGNGLVLGNGSINPLSESQQTDIQIGNGSMLENGSIKPLNESQRTDSQHEPSFVQNGSCNGKVPDTNGEVNNLISNNGLNGTKHDQEDLGEEVLEERDIQIYAELLNRIRNEVVIKESIASRRTVDERKKKINCNLEDEINCQIIILNDDNINSAWSSFRYPRNYDDLLELLFTWADNYFNNQNWPQEEIVLRLKGYPHAIKYDSFKSYSQALVAHILVLFYERLKKDADGYVKSSDTALMISKGTNAIVDKAVSEGDWCEITFKLSSDSDSLRFGNCCILTVVESYTSPDRKYFGTILGKENIEVDGQNIILLTVRTFEFCPISGDRFSILNLFRMHHIYTAAESLFKLKSSQYEQHYFKPNLHSSPSGVTLRFDEKDLSPFDCDAIHKAVDTFSLSSPDTSPICCLDFRGTERSQKDLTDIVVEILLSMRSVPIDIRWIGLDIPALVICNNEEILSILHGKLKTANFPVYKIGRRSSPTNIKEKIPKIGKALAKAFSSAKLIENTSDYAKLYEQWDFAVEGIFTSKEEEKKFNELLELAKVFAIRNSSVVLGNIYDICNDLVINSSLCHIPVCLILGASLIPECFTLPLMKYGCEKFVLIDRELNHWHSTKSLFSRFITLYEEESSICKGAKCCVVTNARKKIKLPEPPIVSRHKLIEAKPKDNLPSDYNPDQRKNPRNRLPYCPKPTTSTSDSNKSS